MSSDQPDEKEVFNRARSLEDSQARAEYLNEVCPDSASRRRIEQLLAAYQEKSTFLQAPALPGESTETLGLDDKQESPTIGPYKLLQPIGEGGMGTVYMAEQKEPVKRRVALKIIKPGMDSRQVIARFEAERQALALMDHPHIAKVLDAGTTPAGRPYFVMELVKGMTITEYCNAKRLSIRERIELLLPVCRAIQHAHQKGIIHRDIKPSNVLVGVYDHDVIPKVIDFGVAKAIHQPLTERTMFTGFGQVIGTLGYMSPEQAKVNNLDIDTRSDIYSLGVLLYELLSGVTPFDPERLRTAAIEELLRILRDEEPPKPSNRLSTVKDSLPSIAAERQVTPNRLTTLLSGELDWVIMKALDKDRDRRYPTATALAEDLQRYLDHDTVEARPPSVRYRLGKFVRRYRVVLSVAGSVFLLLIAALASVSWSLRQARLANAEALAANTLANERLEQVQQAEAEAIEAYRSSMDDAIQKLILSKDDIGESEREYLNAALERWLEFSRRQGTSSHAKEIRAQAFASIGEVYDALSDHQAAYDAFQKSIEIYRKLTSENSSRETRFKLARVLFRKANITSAAGYGQDQPEAYNLAAAEFRKLCQDFPDDVKYWRNLATVLNNLGVILRQRTDLQSIGLESTDVFLQAREQFVEISERFPNEDVRSDILRIDRNLASNYRMDGENAKALEMLRQIADGYRELEREHPGEYEAAVAYTLFQIAISLSGQEAIDAYLEVIPVQQALVDKYPSQLLRKYYLGASLCNVAERYEQLGDLKRSGEYFERGFELFSELNEKEPTNSLYRSNYAGVARTRARRQLSNSLLDAARDSFEQTLALSRELREAEPHAKNHIRAIGTDLVYLAEVERLAGNAPKALELCQQAENEFMTLYSATTPDRYSHSLLISLCELRASIYASQEKYDDQQQQYVQAVQYCRELIDAFPESSSYRLSLALNQARCGQVKEALAEAERQLEESQPDNRNRFLQLGRLYAIAHDKTTPANNAYRERALNSLDQARQKGFLHFERLLLDPDFQSLRDTPEFDILTEQMKTRRANLIKSIDSP